MDFEFLILETLYHSPLREADQSILFNLDKSSINEIKTAINDLVEKGYIKQIVGSTKYKLISQGITAYKQLKYCRDQDAKNEKQQRFTKRVTIISLVIALITLVISFVEFLLQLFDFI